MNALLVELQELVAERCGRIVAGEEDWPCRQGCDLCCRRLAELPSLTRAEWELLHEALEQGVPDWRARVAPLVERAPAAPVTCPFLDRDAGVCLVYHARPLACRTYGFYRERDKGLYCTTIESRETTNVVWGNQEALERRAAPLGERIGFAEWFGRVQKLASR